MTLIKIFLRRNPPTATPKKQGRGRIRGLFGAVAISLIFGLFVAQSPRSVVDRYELPFGVRAAEAIDFNGLSPDEIVEMQELLRKYPNLVYDIESLTKEYTLALGKDELPALFRLENLVSKMVDLRGGSMVKQLLEIATGNPPIDRKIMLKLRQAIEVVRSSRWEQIAAAAAARAAAAAAAPAAAAAAPAAAAAAPAAAVPAAAAPVSRSLASGGAKTAATSGSRSLGAKVLGPISYVFDGIDFGLFTYTYEHCYAAAKEDLITVLAQVFGAFCNSEPGSNSSSQNDFRMGAVCGKIFANEKIVRARYTPAAICVLLKTNEALDCKEDMTRADLCNRVGNKDGFTKAITAKGDTVTNSTSYGCPLDPNFAKDKIAPLLPLMVDVWNVYCAAA